jgi:hypothetical protein
MKMRARLIAEALEGSGLDPDPGSFPMLAEFVECS